MNNQPYQYQPPQAYPFQNYQHQQQQQQQQALQQPYQVQPQPTYHHQTPPSQDLPPPVNQQQPLPQHPSRQQLPPFQPLHQQHHQHQQQQQHHQHQQQHHQHQQQQQHHHQQPNQLQYQPEQNYYHNQPYNQHPTNQRPMKSLDQNAMPSVAQFISEEIKSYKEASKFLTFTAPAILPPLVTTLSSPNLKMVLQDGGCVRPCHMRSTVYLIPTTKDLMDSSGLEFSVVIKPFDDGEIDKRFVVPLSPNPIVRCNRCKAYINPFSKQGQCCICNVVSKGMQEEGQRPELYSGSYEFRVTPEYYRDQIAANRRPHIIFAIETTVNSRHLVEYVSRNLAGVIKSYFPKDFLYEQPYYPLVGFITYNSKITVYDIKNNVTYVQPDMTSVFAPTPNFLVDPIEDFEKIEDFLGSLVERTFEDLTEQQTVLGPVIEAAFKTCATDKSNDSYFSETANNSDKKWAVPTGKIYILHASLPTSGDDTTPGRLGFKRNIDELKRSLGTDNESKALSPEGKYYTQLAQKCVQDYASGVELFLFPPEPRTFLNIATLGELTRITGTGVLFKYHVSSLENFIQDLEFSLKSTVAFDASMRVRTSTGISPVRYIGNFNNIVGSNLEMSSVNTNSNFIVQMKYDDKLTENDLVIVQFAMIYTALSGERRVRVHNLALSTTQNISYLYKSACCDTLVNTMVRDKVEKMRSGSLNPKAAKEQMTSRVVNILAGYRKHCDDNQATSASQLILPEGLKLLPVYLCGALKCDAIDGGVEMFPDDKALAQLNLLGALPAMSQVTLYPRLFSIQQDSDYQYEAVLTRCFNLAIEEQRGQCYILENGYYLFIYFPNTESGKMFLSAVFDSHQGDQDLVWNLRQKESVETKFLEETINLIVEERRRALKISVVRQARDKMEHVFKTFLYEDKKRPDGMPGPKWDNASYVDILCYLHAEIRAKTSQI